MKILRSVFIYFFVMLILIWTLTPIYWIVLSSFSTPVDLYSTPPHWIPRQITLENFKSILITGKGFRGGTGITATELIKKGLLNSLVVAGSATGIMALLAPLMGYVFARLEFPGKKLFFFYTIGMIAVPSWPVLIGLFAEFSKLKLLDTLRGLIILSVAYRMPFDTWFMRGYISTVPRELDDAARIDGCTRLGLIYKIILPASLPGLIAVVIVSFLFSWNMFLAPLVLTYTLKSKPITVTISEFVSQYYAEWNLMSAGSLIAIIPPVLIVLLFQKYIIKGLTAGAIK